MSKKNARFRHQGQRDNHYRCTSPRERTAVDASSACARKERHADEFGARVAAQRSLHDVRRSAVPRLWVYRCDCCRGWHLTSRSSMHWGEASVTAAELYAEDTLLQA